MAPEPVAGLISRAGEGILRDWPHASVSVTRIAGAARTTLRFDAAGIRAVEDDRARYLVYSLTKTVLALLTLEAVAEHRLGLDADAGPWAADVPDAGRLTIRQLLQHTSGLPDYGSVPEYHTAVRAHPSVPWTRAEFLDRSSARILLFEPGTGWRYSNIGYMIIRGALERIMGESFAEAVAHRVAAPLALTNTSAAVGLDDLRDLEPGWSRSLAPGDPPDAREPIDVRGRYHPGWVAHGVLGSTSAEIALLFHKLLSGQLLDASLFGLLTATVRVGGNHPVFADPCYALGLRADPLAARGATFGHTGEGPGYSAAAYHAAGTRSAAPATVAVLCNAECAPVVESLALALLDEATAAG